MSRRGRSKPPPSWLAVFVLLALGAGLGGCAAAQPPAPSAAPEPQPAPLGPQFPTTPNPTQSATDPAAEPRDPITELDALEYDLQVSEARFEEQLERASSARATGQAPPGASGEPGTNKPDPGSPTTRAPARSASAQTCRLVCRALGSMRRAADGICGLLPDEDPRCERARQRVRSATSRAAAPGCACDP